MTQRKTKQPELHSPTTIGDQPAASNLLPFPSAPTDREKSVLSEPPVLLFSHKSRHLDHKHTIVLDGVKVDTQVNRILVDSEELFDEEVNDGRNGEIDVVQTTELGDSLKELNKDVIQKGTRMSSIDMRANLGETELSAILAGDALVSTKFLPNIVVQYTRQKKRLSASLRGRGREQIVEIVGRKQQEDQAKSGGLFDKMRGIVGGGDKQ